MDIIVFSVRLKSSSRNKLSTDLHPEQKFPQISKKTPLLLSANWLFLLHSHEVKAWYGHIAFLIRLIKATAVIKDLQNTNQNIWPWVTRPLTLDDIFVVIWRSPSRIWKLHVSSRSIRHKYEGIITDFFYQNTRIMHA